MVFDARHDMYLIYLYTRLKNELISEGNAESDLLHACLPQNDKFGRKGNITKSLMSLNEGLSLFRFFEPVVPEDSPLELVRKARARRIMSEEI